MRRQGQDRAQAEAMEFTRSVREAFAFLIDAGFEVVESTPTLMRFQSERLDCNVYVGRRSHELGFQIGMGTNQYSMSELIRLADPSRADDYRNAIVTDARALRTATIELALLVKQYAEPALKNDAGFFDMLREQRTAWSHEYALDVLAGQVRPKAAAAFRGGRYAEAAELYAKIGECLSPIERRKLEIAKRRSLGAI